MQLGVPDGPGLPVVDFHENSLRLFDHGLGIGARRGKAEVSVFVHRRDGDAESVKGDIFPDQPRVVAVVVRHIVRITAGNGFPRAGAGKPRQAVHFPVKSIVRIKSKGIYIHHGMHPDISQFACDRPLTDSLHNTVRLAGAGVYAEHPAVFRGFRQFRGGHSFRFIHLLPILQV